MSYFTKDLLVLVLTLILAVHAAPYPAVNHRDVRIIGNAVRSNNDQDQVFNTSFQYEPGRLARRALIQNRPTWLLSEFNEPKMLTDADKKVFDSELKDLKLGSQLKLTADTMHNGGIWNVKRYKGYSGSPGDLLLKVISLDLSKSDEMFRRNLDYLNYGEVKALKQVGDFVASGYIKDPGLSTLKNLKNKVTSKPPSHSRVIIMKKKDGRTLLDMNAYAHLSSSQFETFATSVKELACKAAAEIAADKGVLHG
ncbi:hypothetical protein D9757_014722 [Collybiopsis confluens]|uniref:Uncharacterized protein n=1 Tax=Collybiopsis confluens TaxID=2823264 RepID=A0A8H5D739_9AGAR|nr:hypothetical protein D9757_014722 [Collybiopsis confluens]